MANSSGEEPAYGNLCNAYQGLGDFKQAIKYLEQDLSVTKEVDDRAREECAYGNLGNAYKGQSEFQPAIKYHDQHLDVAK